MENALFSDGIEYINITPEIAIESTKLPGEFHKDPADQLIVATATIFDISLLTLDKKILDYKHVKTML
jgi:PIN domain nuclease of toxin-antitoxin system